MALNPEHEGLHRIFAQDPAMLASVMTQLLGSPMPAPAAAEPLNVDHSDFLPVLERRSDTVLLVRAGPGDPGGDFILTVESQTDPDETRRAAWPYYLAYCGTSTSCRCCCWSCAARQQQPGGHASPSEPARGG